MATPRPRAGAFPQTPSTTRGSQRRGAPMTPSPSPPPTFASRSFQPSSGSTKPSLRSATGTPRAPLSSAIPTPTRQGPVISTELIDAPAQRAIVVLVYALLVGWKLYDWLQLVENDTEPTWMWLKWMLLDFAFLFGIPELRIPWLELSRPFVLTVYFGHVVFDWMLAFNVGVPWQAWLLAFVRVFFERELAIQEHNVRVSNILHNSSLIMGKQVITILPEGSAVLNPEAKPFCLGGETKRVFVPIVFNATVPEDVELVRTDLESGKEETISLSRKQIKEIKHHASRERGEQETALVNFDFAATKPGAYRLGKVLDEYKLEVQRAGPQTLVVPCPKARVADTTGSADRCIGDLSDLALEVEGTPPLKIVYSRTVNGKDHSFHFQSLQPDGYQSPILAGQQSLAVTLASDQDVSWARAQKVTVGLNESMSNAGDWQYAIDEVHDVFGNSVKYTPAAEEVDAKARSKHLLRNFIVHGRPTLRMARCDLQNPIKIPSGSSASLPVKFELPGRGAAESGYGLTWRFSPLDTLTSTGDHGVESVIKDFKARSGNDLPKVSAPGLYTLKSVSADGCEGEVQEPSSCLLVNPLQPSMTVRSEEIPDTCAGNSIGRRFDIELTGTPPFEVRYDVYENGQLDAHKFIAQGSRHQIEAIPRLAGHHKIVFKQIDDAVYKGIRLKDDDKFVFEQDVRPPARALILSTTGNQNACLGDSVDVDVRLFGEAPYTLEWELVHDGKRTQHKADNIYETVYSIKTEALTKGGEYTLALTGIQDKTGCRNFLQDDVRISVRRQRPRAAFAAIDGKRSTRILEDSKVSLPVRLTGDGPWKVSYRNLNGSAELVQKTFKKTNDALDVKQPGVYEIVEVEDRQCSGMVDGSAATFEVDWFSRPQISVVKTERLDEGKGGTFVKQDVCEGDIDSFELSLTGVPPYHVEYQIRHMPLKGSVGLTRREFDAMLSKATVQMSTSNPGSYSYKFTSLGDSLYDTQDAKFTPLVVEQRVNAKPTATFAKPGQSFKYCLSDADLGQDDTIPIVLTGAAPFDVEFEIKHQSGTIPETFRIPAINANNYNIQIPRSQLRLGTQHIRIRSVRDARGCFLKTEPVSVGPSVQVTLYEAPSIFPLETKTDYCVGERIAYSLSGTPPFEVWYTFDKTARKAKETTTNFRRLAEQPGAYVITGVSDKASSCRAAVNITRVIHPLPAVRISQGKVAKVDIHEGGEVDLQFEFFGTPPFEFTYTRSSNEKKGQRSQVLETRHEVSEGHKMSVRTGMEGTYEVVAIKDRWCSYSTGSGRGDGKAKDGQKLLQF